MAIANFPLFTSTVFPPLATGGPSALASAAASASVVGLPMGQPGLRTEPYFAEEDNSWRSKLPQLEVDGQLLLGRNLTVTAGQTAFLECRVRNLGAKRVRACLHYVIDQSFR